MSGEDTLTGLLAETVARRGDRPAVTDAEGTITWAELAARAEGFAACLAAHGVAPGGRVALWLPNSADYLALCFSLARLGAVAVHLNTRFRAAELEPILARARPSLLVTDGGFAPVDFLRVLEQVPAHARASLTTVLARRAPAGVAPLAAQGTVPDAARPDSPCLTWTTSGTNSGPKLVLHAQGAIASHARDAMRALGLDAAEAALLAAVPICGTFGNAAAMAALAGGAHIVCMERFDGVAAEALIHRHRITHSVGGSDMLERIAEASGERRHETMRVFGYAAFHPAAAAAVEAAEAVGLRPTGLYGSSELQALFAVAPEAHRLEPGGDPVNAGAVVAIRDPLTGAELPEGDAGELCVRAPSMFLGYLDNPEATARAMTPDGLFRTGDLAVQRGRGFLFRTRMGDSLRLSGFLVNPEEIEAFLAAQPGIASAQVVGTVRGGETRVVAFVIPRDPGGFDEAALLAACRTGLARYKVPARIAALEAFPVTHSANGLKIQRARLREIAAAMLAHDQAAVGVPRTR